MDQLQSDAFQRKTMEVCKDRMGRNDEYRLCEKEKMQNLSGKQGVRGSAHWILVEGKSALGISPP